MAADYSRIHRLLKILTLIQGGGGWTPRRLAQECKTTERTIYRDLKMLEGAGIPYFFDEEKKTYAVHKDFFMPPVQLTLDESLALSALAEHVGAREQVPFTEAAGRGIAKIRGQMPASIRCEIDKIEANLAIHLAAANPPEAAADVYAIARAALARRQTLRCEYESIPDNDSAPKTNGSATFHFNPYSLFFGQRAWYMIGWHEGHREVRCLKLTRFTRIEATDGRYSIPAEFSLTSHLGNAWRMIRGSKRYDVELEFDAEFAETIADTHWHATQEVAWQADNSIIFRCSVDGLDEILWWVLSMGDHCIVRKPKVLAEKVCAMAMRMCALYSANTAPASGTKRRKIGKGRSR